LEENSRWVAVSGLCEERRRRRSLKTASTGDSSFVSRQTINGEKHSSARQALIVSVTFHIPGPLRDFTGGRAKVEIEASPNVLEDALKALWTRYPGIRDRLTTEQGEIRQHVNVFVGNEDVRFTGGLTTPIPAGSEISIVAAVSGGRPSPPEPAMI
jgi:molybdopterin synthase sulfur carrier subunit